MLDLPYRMVFSIGTIDQVLIFATDQLEPLAVIGNIHYTSISDMAWQGSEKLAISSSDGYITFVTFDKGFLGQRVKEVPDDIKHFYEAMDKANYDDLLKEAPQVTFKNATFKSKMGPT